MRRGFLHPLLVALAVGGCAPALQEPGTLTQAARLDDTAFVTSDGATLKVQAWGPQGQPQIAPRAVILALHGFNDYRNAFAESGKAWAEQGIQTYAYDQRGFGEAPDTGIWPGAALLARDAAEMARLLRARYPEQKLFLLGESMGAAVAVVAMAGSQPPPVDGVVLVAPAVWGRAFMPSLQSDALAFLAHAMPWLPVSGRGTGRMPSDNIPMLRAQGSDPLVLKYNRIDMVWGLVNLMDDAQAAASRFDSSALVLYGENEQLIPKGPVDTFLQHFPREAAPRQRLAVYPRGFHMLLRDLDGDVVRQDIAAWIADRSAPLPSGNERPLHTDLAKE